jgi:hypothetical protein
MVVLCLSSAGVFAYLAVRENVLGTMENLVADVLAGAVLMVIIREIIVARERRRFLANYCPIYRDIFEAIDHQCEHYSAMVTWASRRVTEKTVDSVAGLDLTLDSVKFGFAPDIETLEAELQALTSDYGTVDFSHLLAELRHHCDTALSVHAEAQTRLKDLRRGRPLFPVAESDALEHCQHRRAAVELLTRDMDRLEHDAQTPLRDLERIKDRLRDSYVPHVAVARYHPEPFVPWLLVLIVLLAALCVGAMTVAYIAPRALPSNFGPATLDNLLAAGVAGFVAAAVATGQRFTTSRRLLVRALPPGMRLLRTLTHIGRSLGMAPDEDRARLLRAIAGDVRDCVNQLQHVIPDASLGRYADDVLAEIDAALARPSDQDHLDVPMERMTALGMPGVRPPSPAAMRLVMASSHLGSRVTEIYIRQRPL